MCWCFPRGDWLWPLPFPLDLPWNLTAGKGYLLIRVLLWLGLSIGYMVTMVRWWFKLILCSRLLCFRRKHRRWSSKLKVGRRETWSHKAHKGKYSVYVKYGKGPRAIGTKITYGFSEFPGCHPETDEGPLIMRPLIYLHFPLRTIICITRKKNYGSP